MRFPHARPLTVNELLRWPGVMAEAELAQDDMPAEVQAALATTLAAFVESRQREGAALEAMLLSRVDDIEAIVAQITPLVPQAVDHFRQKATERMQEDLNNASVEGSVSMTREEILDRIRQEVTLYGIRVDVAEELNRLSGHLTETRAILKKGGQVGKRLDFMMQELNREANTLGSKAAVKALSDAAMQMKLLIEQMREQVQNLE
jgi:uncharacterized protein (TIGR00255 family)